MYSKRKLIFNFLNANKLLVGGALLAALFSNFLNVMLPLSIGWFYETAFHEHGTKSRLLKLLPLHVTTANIFFIAFGSLILMKAILMFLEKFLVGITGERFSRDIRELTFSHQLHHSMSTHRLRPVGKYLLRYSGDLLAIQNFVSRGILVFSGDVFFLLSSFSVLFFINQKLALVVATLFLIGGGIAFLLSKKLRTVATDRRNQRSKNLGFVSSRMQAFYTIKSFNRETPEENSFVNRSRKLYRLGIRFFSVASFMQAVLPLFLFGAIGCVLFFALQFREAKPYGITKGDTFTFVLLLLYMQSVMRRLLKVNIVWQVGLISFDKLLTLVQLPGEKRSDVKSLAEVKGNIEFKNVSFAYESGKPVIQNLSFYAFANSLTVLKGKQGTGKTTLLKLIQKIYEPTSGKILFDKIDSVNITPFELRREITIVSDEVPLLGGTVFKAISYSTSEEKREKAIAMLQRLKIQLAENDNDNLDYKLEDGGKNLSAGERTMLQFARALLTRKQILLLDEPFKNLDETSVAIMVDRLNKLKDKRTIIVVSDQLPGSLLVDQIITTDVQEEIGIPFKKIM